MGNSATIEAKAYVPARDFELSKQFYQDLSFDLAWSSDALGVSARINSKPPSSPVEDHEIAPRTLVPQPDDRLIVG